MSPLRRGKRGSSRARSRRQELVERERLRYLREQDPAVEEPAPDPEAEPARPAPRRPARRPRLGGLRDASSSGLRATARRTSPGLRRALGRVGHAAGWLLAWVFILAEYGERLLIAAFDISLDAGERALAFADEHLTPERVLVGVIAGASASLGISQFVAYRGVEVGQPGYSAVSDIAPPPQTDRVEAGAAHAYVLIPLAILAVAAAALALLRGRWRLARVVSVVGLLGIAVSLAIDLPSGLDAGSAGESFAGAHATMTEGFYAQLAASATLAVCGWLLSRSLRQRAGALPRSQRVRSAGPRPRRAPSVAGGGA